MKQILIPAVSVQFADRFPLGRVVPERHQQATSFTLLNETVKVYKHKLVVHLLLVGICFWLGLFLRLGCLVDLFIRDVLCYLQSYPIEYPFAAPLVFGPVPG